MKVECKKISLLDFFAETHPVLSKDLNFRKLKLQLTSNKLTSKQGVCSGPFQAAL